MLLTACGRGPTAADGPLEIKLPADSQDAAVGRPNFILISIDTLNRSALRCYEPSAPPLPFLDELAAESVRFTHALTPASWTLPAHASLFTGLYPNRHGATDPRVPMSNSVATLAGSFSSEYETVAFASSVFFDPAFGLNRGFEKYTCMPDVVNRGDEISNGCDSVFARAAEFVSTRPAGGRPLFVFIQAYSVHDYYKDGLAEDSAPEDESISKRNLEWVAGWRPCSAETWQQLERNYLRRVSQVSRDFALFAEALKRARLWETSVILFVSDHGEGFEPELGRIHHGGQLHADVISIPFLVRVPGLIGHDEESPVSLIDVMPSLLQLSGIELPSDLDGRSFASILRPGHAPTPVRTLYAIEHAYWWNQGRCELVEQVSSVPLAVASVLVDRWGIVDLFPSGRVASTRAECVELYDTVRDPGQRAPLTDPKDIAAFEQSVVVPRGDRPMAYSHSTTLAIDERLRKLGYAH